MARSIRIQYKNALYHIYSRGQRKENIFLDNNDRKKFIKKLEETIENYLFMDSDIIQTSV